MSELSEATVALITDLKMWACSPRVPLKAQLVMLEAVGRLSTTPSERVCKNVGSSKPCEKPHCFCAEKKQFGDMDEELIRRLREADAKRSECTAHSGPHTILGEAANALEQYISIAKAWQRAYEAELQREPKPGWCSVPVEPTQAMLDAGNAADYASTSHRSAGRIWRAMLGAIQSPPACSKIERCRDGSKCSNAETGCCWGRCIKDSVLL